MGKIESKNKLRGVLFVGGGIVLSFANPILESYFVHPLSESFGLIIQLFKNLGIALIVGGLMSFFDLFPYVSIWKKISEVSEQIKNGFTVIKSANEVGINGIFVRHVNNIQTKRFEDKRFEDKIIEEIKKECSRNDGEILISCVAAMDFFSNNGPMIGETIFSLFGNLKHKCKLKVLILSPDSEGAKYREKLEPQHPLIDNIKISIKNLSNLRILFNWNEILNGDYSKLKNFLEQSFEYKLDIKNIKRSENSHIKLTFDDKSHLNFFDPNVNLVINDNNYNLTAENENGTINVINPNVQFKLYDFLPPVFLIITHDFAFIETYPIYKVENRGESIGGRCPMLMVRNLTSKGEETETYKRWKKHFYYVWENLSQNINEDMLTKNSILLFCWEDIIENKTSKLIDFLKRNYGEGLVKDAKIETENKNQIRITAEKTILLNLDDKNTQVKLLIDDVINDELIVKTENGKRNIYQSYIYPSNIRNVIESIQKNVCSNCYKTPTFHFSNGFETHELYKTILELSQQSQHRLWVFGRKNRKLFDRDKHPFIDKILEKKSRQEFDLRVLFLSPHAPNNIIYKSHANTEFKEELESSINEAKKYFNHKDHGMKYGIKFNEICRYYSKQRCIAMIIIDQVVIFSRIKTDKNGVTKKLTNESFEIVSTDSKIGKNLLSRFEETWSN